METGEVGAFAFYRKGAEYPLVIKSPSGRDKGRDGQKTCGGRASSLQDGDGRKSASIWETISKTARPNSSSPGFAALQRTELYYPDDPQVAIG